MPTENNISQLSHRNQAATEELQGLVRDCIARKRPAQRKLYETYAPAVYNVIKRYVYDDHAAQEILNDTFHKVFTRLHQYSWQGPLEAWMRRIAVNTVTDHIRKYIKHNEVTKTEVHEEDVYMDSDAVANINFKELVSFTYKLPELHRAVFNLYVFEDMTHKQVGECLNISEGNSRWILNDARKRLKQLILSSMS